MPIRFPVMHIADSVVNRILNVNDELDAAGQATPTPAVPSLPNAPSTPAMGIEGQGLKINEQTDVSSVVQGLDGGPEAETPSAPVTPGSVIQGANLIDSIA